MKTVRRLFFAGEENKEQFFLEDMARKGYKLVSVGLARYHFEEMTPKEVVYQFDFKGMDNIDEAEYQQYYEEAGWGWVTGYGSWYYFYQEKDEALTDLEIFNNNESKRAKFRRLLIFLLITGFPLYYQVLIFLPYLAREGDIGPFFRGLRIMVTILALLHGYALIRLGLGYRKLLNQIKE